MTPKLFYCHLPGGCSTGVSNSITVGSNQLILQSDGNLVIYESGVACWSSGTSGTSADALYFQADGNLVLLDSNNNHVYWASNIYSACGNREYAYLTFQTDGNLVMRYPHEISGSLSDPGHYNVDSYKLGDINSGGR